MKCTYQYAKKITINLLILIKKDWSSMSLSEDETWKNCSGITSFNVIYLCFPLSSCNKLIEKRRKTYRFRLQIIFWHVDFCGRKMILLIFVERIWDDFLQTMLSFLSAKKPILPLFYFSVLFFGCLLLVLLSCFSTFLQ